MAHLLQHPTEKVYNLIRAVVGQRSSPELRLANKTKMHLKQKKKTMNSKSLEYEDVLYFDLQTHGMYPGVSRYGMEAGPPKF